MWPDARLPAPSQIIQAPTPDEVSPEMVIQVSGLHTLAGARYWSP
jgi:hypothetical protein